MKYRDIERLWGQPPSIAKALGTTRQRVEYWRAQDRIPHWMQEVIQHKTNGRLRADEPKESA